MFLHKNIMFFTNFQNFEYLNKWKKWMINKKDDKKDLDKAIIAGHYIFSSKSFKKLIKNFLKKNKLSQKKLNLYLKKNIKNSILRYVKNFNLIQI